jgi:ABC-2 type transport system ATP-binding protein
MLELNRLKKYYAGVKAVDDISFNIPEGGIFGLLGPNGAGKSTLLRMLTGITIPDEGEIRFKGALFNPSEHTQLIVYMPEERGLYKKMKIGEQALYLAQLKGLSKQEATKRLHTWFDRLDMLSWWHKKVEDLSKGMSQKLQFVTTVVHQPAVLILDEPFSGLDPVNSDVIKKEIFNLAQAGTTIIFSTHRMEQVEEICNEIALINQGHLVVSGSVKTIRERYKEKEYRLRVDGALDGFSENLTATDDGGYRFRYNNEQEVRALLQACLDKQVHITEFSEVLPGLHDIFIRLVEHGAVRQFQ